MATASRHLCRSLLRSCSRPVGKRRCQSATWRDLQLTPSPFRQISTTPRRWADAESKETPRDPEFNEKQLLKPETPYTLEDLDPHERAQYETMDKADQAKYMALQNHVKAVMESDEIAEVSEDIAQSLAREVNASSVGSEFIEERNLKAIQDGYWQIEEDDEFGQVPDEDDGFSGENITSVAESELEVHREIRQYTRIAAWDLPMLLQFTQPFKLPDMKTSPLRFRYTTYMGEHHPAASKVVLQFTTKEVAASAGLTELQRSKLMKLVGPRYNPDKDLVHMSCEKFETQAQNKRYLGDLVQRLVAESSTGDMFEDVPLDLRHHKPKKVHKFPEGWKVGSQESVKKLVERRQSVGLLEESSAEAAEEKKEPVDGKELVEMYVRQKTGMPVHMRAM